MKILKKGGEPKRKDWTGKKMKCEICGCRFQLSTRDRVSRVPKEDDPRVCEIGYKVICPNARCRSKCIFLVS